MAPYTVDSIQLERGFTVDDNNVPSLLHSIFRGFTGLDVASLISFLFAVALEPQTDGEMDDMGKGAMAGANDDGDE